jgi:hypothetical protein
MCRESDLLGRNIDDQREKSAEVEKAPALGDGSTCGAAGKALHVWSLTFDDQCRLDNDGVGCLFEYEIAREEVLAPFF